MKQTRLAFIAVMCVIAMGATFYPVYKLMDGLVVSSTDGSTVTITNGVVTVANGLNWKTNGQVLGTLTVGQFQRTNTTQAITITSLTGVTGSDYQSGILVVSNAAAAGVLVTWPATWINNLGYVSAYCTNAEEMLISVGVLPGVQTNAAILRMRKGAAGVAP